MKPVIECTPVIAECPNKHFWNTEILPGSTMPQTPGCPICGLTVSSYPSLREVQTPRLNEEPAPKIAPWLCANPECLHFKTCHDTYTTERGVVGRCLVTDCKCKFFVVGS